MSSARVQLAADRELVVDDGRLEPAELRSAPRLLLLALRAVAPSARPECAGRAFHGGLVAGA